MQFFNNPEVGQYFVTGLGLVLCVIASIALYLDKKGKLQD